MVPTQGQGQPCLTEEDHLNAKLLQLVDEKFKILF